MNIADLFKKEHTVFSFEVFPPKKESGIETIYSTLNELKNLNPMEQVEKALQMRQQLTYAHILKMN